MLSNLALISVMILSLLLLVNCVDSHKENILTTLNRKQKSIESLTSKENLNTKEITMKQEVSVPIVIEKSVTKEVIEPKKIEKENLKIEKVVETKKANNLSELERAILKEVKKMEKN